MSKLTIREQYNKLEQALGTDGLGGEVDHLLCDVVTRVIEIPEVRQAVIQAALRANSYIKEDNPDTMGDIPFYVLWNHLMTELSTLDQKEES